VQGSLGAQPWHNPELSVTLDALIARLTLLEKEVQEEVVREMERVAIDGIAIVTQRVSETGKDADGRAFKPYTKRYELYKRGAIGGIKNESAKKRAARKTTAATADKPVGKYQGFVDFTLTSRMLTNITIIERRNSNGRAVVVAGGNSEETRGKMEGNDNYRPGWFRIGADEAQRLAARSKARMEKWAAKFLTE
jgi:hypothetical protein